MTDVVAPKPAGRARTDMADHSEGMSYLESVPRQLVTLYLPLLIFLVILLFPFDWMALTATLQVLEFDGFLTVEREQGDDKLTDVTNGVKFLKRFALPAT